MYRPVTSNSPRYDSTPDVESTIRGLTQDYCMAFNTGNYDQAAALFAADGHCLPPNRESAQGPKSIERLLRTIGESGAQDLRLETIRVDHSGDMALEVGIYTLAVALENGTSVPDRGKYVKAWRRLGAWMIVASSWNSSLPPIR